MVDDERPQYQHGVGTIGGAQFHWGSGEPGKYWSIPYGDYPVTPNAPTGAWAHQAGAIPIANNIIPDPLLGRNRVGIMIHSGSAPDLDTLYTQGCFKVAPSEWPAVRSEILAEADKGPLYLHVAPGGVAAFTNTKTFSQAGDDTPAATANATANTAAAPSASGPAAKPSYTFALPANAPMGMGNNNPLNIKYYKGAEATYPGLIGPSSNTDQGDPQMKFASPEAGWSAAYSLLNKKYGSGMTTPNEIIAGKGGWTPGNTQAAANVAKTLGIAPDDDIGFSDPGKAQKFMRALVTQEQGGAGSAYPDAMITGAITGKPSGATTTASTVPGTTLNSSPTVAGGPSAPPATGQPGQPSGGLASSLPGFQANSPGAKMTATGLQSLFGGQGAGASEPPPMQLAQAPPAQAMGGPMMIGPHGQNTFGARTAQQLMPQPTLAAFTPPGVRSPVPSTLQSTIQPMAPGGATGIPGLPGTTLNSPSQLQMALMTGAMSPYDLYANAGIGGGFGTGSS